MNNWRQLILDTPWSQTALTVLLAAAAAAATLIAARIVSRICRRVVEGRRQADPGTAMALGFLRYLAVAAVYFAGLAVIVSLAPALNSALTKLLAAGGVLAVVGGLAAQEALGSVVSGIMILVFKPFKLGDVVRYIDHDISGVIEEITLHHTAIRTWENKRVIVPNSKMNAAVIENADYGESRLCVFLEVGITYESDVALAKELLAGLVAQEELHLDVRTGEQRTAGEPEVQVVVLRLDASAVVLRASLWAADNSAAFSLRCAVQEKLLKVYAENGVEIAYPHIVVAQKQSG